jgi:hypothetical protein
MPKNIIFYLANRTEEGGRSDGRCIAALHLLSDQLLLLEVIQIEGILIDGFDAEGKLLL